jgi:tRNA-2-methylthio-N6-dimethylallyladenosine synthase
MGRSTQNKVIVFPKNENALKKGDYVNVKVTDCTKATLMGEIIN